MAQESRTQLKTYFQTDDVPTEAQFANLIDSLVPEKTIYQSAQVGDVTYIGIAETGATTGEAKWKICKQDVSSGELVMTFADGNTNYDNIWDDHLTLTYS